MKFFNAKYILYTLLSIIIIFLLYVSITNFEEQNRIVTDFLNYINLLITPLGIILGVALGYPLLKRKLIESYVTKQYDTIYDANRKLRKYCLQLIEKYPSEYISTTLEKEYLQQIIIDIKQLVDYAFDANPDAHKYSKLLLTSLQEFAKEQYPKERYYKETLSTFINVHVQQIYNYAKSLGTDINSTIKERKRLVNKLDPFVIDNKFIELATIDFSLNFKKSSSLLVIFFSNSFSAIDSDLPFLFLSVYKAIPSPCPLARLMLNREIYIPLVLATSVPIWDDFRLYLVGFKRKKHTNMSSGKVTYSYTCYYANISDFGFVEGTIKDRQNLINYKDAYIESTPIEIKAIENFEKFKNEIIGFKIEETSLKEAYKENRKRLIKQLKKEI